MPLADICRSAVGILEISAHGHLDLLAAAVISHNTMNSAIMAVTKSAYATFQAPPWWPPWPLFFLMMMMGACAMVSYPPLPLRPPWRFFRPAASLFNILNEGRTCPGTARRPISTARIGASPLKNAIMPDSQHHQISSLLRRRSFPCRTASGPTNP